MSILSVGISLCWLTLRDCEPDRLNSVDLAEGRNPPISNSGSSLL